MRALKTDCCYADAFKTLCRAEGVYPDRIEIWNSGFARQSAAIISKLSRRQKTLLERLKPGDQLAPSSYYEEMQGIVSQRQAQRDLSGLESGGWLRQEGEGPSTVYIRTRQDTP